MHIALFLKFYFIAGRGSLGKIQQSKEKIQ